MLDRRSFIAATAMLGLAGRTFAKDTDYDVIIIGAGVAGLAAARRLSAQGHSFVVLEARNRIGGRTLTTDFMGVPVDHGAHWLHNSEINPMVPIARAEQLALTPSSRAEGRFFEGPGIFADGAETILAESTEALYAQFFNNQDMLATASLADFAKGDGALAADVIAFAIGEEPNKIAALDVAMMAEENIDFTVEGGMGAFIQRFGANIPVQLGAQVDQIDWSKPGVVEVSGKFGKVRGKTCLVTVPPAVLSATPGIRFLPDLPTVKQEAIARLPMGVFTKVALRTRKPLDELPTYSIDSKRFFNGELHALHHAPGEGVVTLMLGGNAARTVIDAGEASAIEEAKSVLAAVAGSSAVTEVSGGLLSEWLSDPFALGSYAHVLPGPGNPRDDFAMPLDNRIFFAGDTLGKDLVMTVGGAYQSAESTAAAIHEALI